MKNYLTYTAVLLLLFLPVKAADYHFSRITTDEGLSHNDITTIIQDADGFMWFATRGGLNRYDGKRVKSYRIDAVSHPGINSFSGLCRDEEGGLWAASESLFRYNRELDKWEEFTGTPHAREFTGGRLRAIASVGKVIYFTTDESGLYAYHSLTNELTFIPFTAAVGAFTPSALWVDGKDRIWIGGNNGKLLQYQLQSNEFHTTEIGIVSAGDQVKAIKGNERLVYIALQYSGVICYDKESGVCSLLPVDRTSATDLAYIHDIWLDNQRVWVATEGGLYIYDEVNKRTTHLVHDYFDPFSLSDNAVYAVYKDNEEGMWVGTYFAGVNYLSLKISKFIEKYYPLAGRNSISGKAVREVCQDRYGKIWIGTEDAGLNRYDPQTGRFEKIELSYYNVHGLEIVEDKLLAGTYLGGINVVDLVTGRVEAVLKIVPGRFSDHNSIYSLVYDSRERIWVGTSRGVYLLSFKDKKFTPVEGLESTYAHHIMEDKKGNIWLSSPSDGMLCITPEGEIVDITPVIREQLGITTDLFLSCLEDSRGCVWMFTANNGAIKYNPQTNQVTRFSGTEGLPHPIAYKGVEDEAGNIWYGTNKGLVKIDPVTKGVRVFTKREGLPTNQFNYNSAFKDTKGKLWFGTVSGLVIVDPSAADNNEAFPDAYVTELKLFNQEVQPAKEGILPVSLLTGKEVNLSYSNNSPVFNISVIRFSGSQANTCYALLEGVDKEWRLLEGELSLSYANLSPGKYLLKLKTSNSLGEWKEVNRLSVVIQPPFWRTVYAKAGYLFLFLITGAWVYRRGLIRLRKKRELWMERLEQEKERENYHSKMVFFTNIAHEIKTPLSLIKAPLDYILDHKEHDADTKENLDTIKKNTDRLLSLTCQLLDFRKVEAGALELNLEHADVASLVKLTVDRFKPAMELKGITPELRIDGEEIYADVDVENLTKILSNLLNNALKFSFSFILVEVRREEEKLIVAVGNDGPQVPAEMVEKIFQPFVQLPEHGDSRGGKGLGLALSRSLAELHGGELLLDISRGTNCFILRIPLVNQEFAERKRRMKERIENINLQPVTEVAPHTVLLVEDNTEMLEFLYKRLVQEYRVIMACDGEEALKRLEEEDVDAIVSDVMMPRMDGFEMLQVIKSEVAYSHIPVVLLTAKTNLQSRITGLELGADAYVEKPFSIDHLQVQIRNLIKRRMLVKEQFSTEPLVQPETVALTRADEYFLEKLNEHIYANLTNTQFSVDVLAEKLYMSRSSLLRKIKGLCNLTPNDYIRICRLKRAAQLIQEGELRINEIAVVTGFTGSSYFAKCFQQHFGILPREFAKKSGTSI